MSGNNTQTKITERLLLVALFSLTVFFFGPLQIFLANLNEFPFPITGILELLACLTLGILILVMLLLSLIPKKYSDRILSLLLATTFLLWLQGNVMVWNYGLMDGHDIEWGKKSYLGLLDTPLWFLVLALALIYTPFIKKITRRLSLILITAQILNILLFVVPNAKSTSMNRFSIDGKNEFSYSSSRNIIIVVLDTFQTDIFQELLNENRNYEKVFSGFTYFRNSLSGSPSTKTAIPEILTARQYDNSLPIADFLKNSYTENSLPLLLKKNSYRCDIFPLGGVGIGMYLDRNLASNLKDRFPVSFKDLNFIIDLSLFRQTPHFLKIAIYNRQSWFLSRIFKKTAQENRRSRKINKSKTEILPDRFFTESMTCNAKVDCRQPVFKFYHLRGLHPPLRMNSLCQLEKMEFNRHNYKVQAKGLLQLVDSFLGKLKQIDAFRNSMILIIGDHGPGNWGLCEINLKALGISFPEIPLNKELLKIKAGALPLMLMKPAENPGEEPLTISDAPVCLGDIPVTVASAIRLKNNFPGRPLFSVQTTENRLRRYKYYIGFNSNKQGFMEPISEYWVQGFSWFDKSWQMSPNIYFPSNKIISSKTLLPRQ